MARIEDLERRLDVIAGRIRAGVENLVGDVTEEIGRDLVPATPVDTGFARGNWRPSIGAPSSVPISTLDPTGAATIARIAAVANRYRLGDTIFIVNRVRYIGRLNEGSSPQAAPRFVQTAIEAGFARGVRRFAAGIL